MSVTFRSLTNGIHFKKTHKKTEEIIKDEEEQSAPPPPQLNSAKAIQKSLGIRVHGEDVPEPLSSWWDLSGRLPEGLIEIVSKRYPHPTPIQAQSIPVMLQGRDILATAPTGSGKTAAYLLPLLHHQGKSRLKAIILCPTRELSLQIHEEATQLLPPTYKTKVQVASAKKSNANANILISTPNTLVYLINQEKSSSSSTSHLDFSSLEWLIVDESDKLFEDKGTGCFREQLAVVYKACAKSRKAFFSATLATDVEEWCKINLDNAVSVTIGIKNIASKDVKQRLVYTGNEKGKIYALKDLIRGGIKPPVLVFVQDFQRADELKDILLKEENIKAEVIHSHRSLLQREEALKSFRSGRSWVLICTELLSRGIDVKGVNLVLNYDFPPSSVSYIHRVGRTGRAGRVGEAVTFFTDEDKTLLRSIATIVSSSGNKVPEYMLKLKKASRQEKRRLARESVKRDSVRGESKYDRRKRLKREEIILASRKRKMKKEASEKGQEFDENKFEAKFGQSKDIKETSQTQQGSKKRKFSNSKRKSNDSLTSKKRKSNNS